MRALVVAAACLFVVRAAAAADIAVRVQESVLVDAPGATAAYTINPEIADTAAPEGDRLLVTGRSPGTTQLIVVTATGVQSHLVTVTSTPIASSSRPQPGVPLTRYTGRYSSNTSRLQNAIDFSQGDETRRSEFSLLHVRERRGIAEGASDSIASIFYRHTTAERQLTLFDAIVEASRVTIDNTQLRGLHLRQGPLELHGGYAASTFYDGFFLAADRRWAAGGSYAIDGDSIRWTPSLYGFFSEPEGTHARRGVVAALAAEHRDGDALYVRGDVGVSRAIAASGELRYNSERDRFRALASFKPDDHPTLGLSDLAGTHAELDWNRRASDRLTITSYGTYDRFDLAEFRQTIGSGTVSLRQALSRRVGLLGGGDVSIVRAAGTSFRSVGIPIGLTYDSERFGAAATYRLIETTGTSRRGDEIRLSTYASGRGLNANLWVERQRHAPSLDLIFRETPGLELALLRLGISVHDPEDVARALRDNAALIDLGYISGVTVNLSPERLQAGLNIGWLGAGPHNDRLRLLAVYDRDEAVGGIRDGVIATLTYERRIFGATDVFGSYSAWRTSLRGATQSGSALELGLRQQFTGLPRFLQRSGTIEGFVFLDPAMEGVRNAATTPLAGIVVTLDGSRTTRTDARGAYAFAGVAAGSHRITAQLPAEGAAIFTTPSHYELGASARADFGIAWAAARVAGRVVGDDGDGIGGVNVTATQNGRTFQTTSDSDGQFAFAVAPGTVRIVLAAESLPAGYSVAGQSESTIAASVDEPRSLRFDVHARRSVAGKAAGATEVRIESLGRKAPVDAAGNFVFRSMPAGTFVLTARSGNRVLSSTVTLPPEPATIGDVVLGANGTPSIAAAVPTSPRPPIARPSIAATPSRETSANGTYVVQTGAFRDERNARPLLTRLQRLGQQAFTSRASGFTRVFVGPFLTQRDAVTTSLDLRRAGLDAFVKRKSPGSP